MLMYNDIFVAPKQKELELLKKKDDGIEDFISNKQLLLKNREDQVELDRIMPIKNLELNHSNMMNESQHETKKNTKVGYMKTNDKVITIEDGGESIMKELKLTGNSPNSNKIEDETDIIEYMMNKYNSSGKQQIGDKKQKKQSESIFSSQIEVEPPESSYFTKIISPLIPA